MKKTIIYLSLALVAFSNVSMANVSSTSNDFYWTVKKEAKSATPLATAIAKGDLETVKKFIEYGADINEQSNGMTPLMIAARYNQVEIIKLLLVKGANLKLTNDKGLTALKYAELSNATQAVETLKQAKA
jgi:ankyrin repeat protein